MSRQSRLLAAGTALSALFAAAPAHADMVFNRIASFPVYTNLPADADPASETSSEIIYVTEDGMTLVYSDSPFGGIDMIDISDPANPAAGGNAFAITDNDGVDDSNSETLFLRLGAMGTM